MKTFGMAAIEDSVSCETRIISMFASTVFSLNAFTSAPAEKNFSDALRTTTTFTASSAAASRTASASSSMNARS